ncbi:MAG: hypothetical protein AAB588_06740 [Patescibacteria group bacterium]
MKSFISKRRLLLAVILLLSVLFSGCTWKWKFWEKDAPAPEYVGYTYGRAPRVVITETTAGKLDYYLVKQGM